MLKRYIKLRKGIDGMFIKYNIEINNDIIAKRFQSLINQVYKLLPTREQGVDWTKPLQTILEELIGMQRLLNCGESQIYFSLLSKMEGMYSLIQKQDFQCYRRTIFECLNLMNTLKQQCLQNC